MLWMLHVCIAYVHIFRMLCMYIMLCYVFTFCAYVFANDFVKFQWYSYGGSGKAIAPLGSILALKKHWKSTQVLSDLQCNRLFLDRNFRFRNFLAPLENVTATPFYQHNNSIIFAYHAALLSITFLPQITQYAVHL